MKGYPDIVFRGRTVTVVIPIQSHMFDTMEEFEKVADEQGYKEVIVTPLARRKYQSLLFKPEEMENDKKQ